MNNIRTLTQQQKDLLLSKSAFSLPDNPSDKNFSPAQVRRKLYEGLLVIFEYLNDTIDQINANVILENTDIANINTAIGDINTALNGKVNKITTTGLFAYVHHNSTDLEMKISSEAEAGIAMRGADGVLKVGTPTENSHAVTKQYADNKFVEHRSQSGNNAYVNVGGTDTLMKVSSNAEGGIMSRNSSGQTKVGDPTDNAHAANKGYVDGLYNTNAAAIDTKVSKVNYPSTLVAYIRDHGIEGAREISTSNTANTIAQRDANGRIKATAPSNDYDVANKNYVDTQIAIAISTVYKIKGSKTVAQLNALSAQEIGDTYNVSDEGTLTEGNLHVLAGDNVVWDGFVWDKLAGTVDLTGYYTKVQVDALLLQKATISATVMDTDLIVSGGFITQISRNGEYIPVAQEVAVTTIPKVVQSTSNLPATNDGYLYLVMDNGYLYSWQNNTWTQAYQYTSDLFTITTVVVDED